MSLFAFEIIILDIITKPHHSHTFFLFLIESQFSFLCPRMTFVIDFILIFYNDVMREMCYDVFL